MPENGLGRMASRARRAPEKVRGAQQRAEELAAMARWLQRMLLERRERAEDIEALLARMAPEVVPLSDQLERAVHKLLARSGFSSELNLNIAVGDLMYRWSLLVAENANVRYPEQQATLLYFRNGIASMRVLRPIVERRFGGFDGIGSFLDFASGYGRLSRFLVQEIDPRHVWVSDIKAGAVDFQRRQLGVRGFISSERPEDLVVDERFDCIFVVSLFTHLPEATFARWLERLCDLLTPEGMLIFTVHDTSLLGDGRDAESADEIVFTSRSEETRLLANADGALDAETYGTTHVSEGFVRRVIEQLPIEGKHYRRYERALGKQDVYILSRRVGDDLSGLRLPRSE